MRPIDAEEFWRKLCGKTAEDWIDLMVVSESLDEMPTISEAERQRIEYITEDEKAHEIKVRDDTVFAFDLASGWYIDRVLIDYFGDADGIDEIQITVRRNR